MPKLRRLNGLEVIAIFKQFDFSVIRVKGSHHRLKRVVGKQSQYLTIPVHGKKALKLGTLKSIYRDGCNHIDEEELYSHFYTD